MVTYVLCNTLGPQLGKLAIFLTLFAKSSIENADKIRAIMAMCSFLSADLRVGAPLSRYVLQSTLETDFPEMR